MRHIPVEPPAFFHRGPSPLSRLAFFGLISVALLFVDTRYRYLEDIRHVAATALYPLQRAAQLPGDGLAWVGRYFASQRSLTEDNAELKRRLAEYAAAAQAFAAMQQENARLRSVLDVRTHYAAGAKAVEVLYTGRDPFVQKLFVDKGADADIRPGEAVIDADGVVGQVTRVYPYMAEVTLVTDKDHAVPVKVQRSGVRSVLYGAGAGRAPELRFTAPSADIQVGDVLVTSGLDGTYPPGLAVARVTTVERDTGEIFARIACAPLAGVDRSEHLLILGQAAAAPPPARGSHGTRHAEEDGKRQTPGRGSAMMVLPNMAQLSTAGPEEILRPVRPWFIVLTLAFALFANLLPLSGIALALRPDFIALVLLYWCIQEPRYVGVGVAWGVGLVMDVGDATLFGQHALAYAFLAYAAEYFRRRVLRFPLWQQAAQVAVLLGLCAGLVAAGTLRGWRAAAALDLRGPAARRRAPLASCHAHAAVAAATTALVGHAVTPATRLH